MQLICVKYIKSMMLEIQIIRLNVVECYVAVDIMSNVFRSRKVIHHFENTMDDESIEFDDESIEF